MDLNSKEKNSVIMIEFFMICEIRSETWEGPGT